MTAMFARYSAALASARGDEGGAGVLCGSRGRARDAHVEAGARRFAMTLGRALELSLLAHHAQWSLEQEKDQRTRAAPRRFAAHGVSPLAEMGAADSRRLARDDS